MMDYPYSVRKQSSGRAFSETYVVVRRGERVSTHPHRTRATAQAEADELNVSGAVKDHNEDPRPYEVRRAEAETAYRVHLAARAAPRRSR